MRYPWQGAETFGCPTETESQRKNVRVCANVERLVRAKLTIHGNPSDLTQLAVSLGDRIWRTPVSHDLEIPLKTKLFVVLNAPS